MKLYDAAEVFGISLDETEPTMGELDARWRELRSALHPDREGGDADKFAEAKQAYDVLHKHLNRPRICNHCNGHGTTLWQKGFTTLHRKCTHCDGTGEVRRVYINGVDK